MNTPADEQTVENIRVYREGAASRKGAEAQSPEGEEAGEKAGRGEGEKVDAANVEAD